MAFMKLTASGNGQFRTSKDTLGIEELFLPNYIMIPLKLQYLDDPGFVNHAIFFGQRIPDGQLVTRDELGYKYTQKVKIKEEELRLSHPVLYRRICWRIYKNKLDLDEVEKKLKRLTEGLPVQTRLKSPAGFYSRVKSRRESLNEVDDINGARIICPSASVCYIVSETVFRFFRDSTELPNVIDKIPVPKTNGFQGLIVHLKYCGKPLEIQIQTENMYRNAEFGVASEYRQT